MMTASLAWHALPSGSVAGSTASMSDAVPGDSALVRASLAGDDSAFAELIRRHKGRVFGTCSRFARDAHQLDDLCQEVFLRAWRKMGSFRGDAPFEHWLARLTITSCYDFLRRERRHRDQLSLDEFPTEMRDSSADAAIAAGRARELVDWGMRHLSAEERLVLTLLELEEHTVREIAAETGWSESNVKVRAFRARARLKEILERSHES
jgi:RNA polymerase sigma-70 factor (ECF subfamily)